MPATEAQIAANRRNAQQSTGPRTAEGKARSRENAVQHGMTGAGVALPPVLASQVAREFAAVQAELRPQTTLGAFLLEQATLASVRCRHAARQESASLARRIRHAVADHDDARAAEVDHALDHLADDPATHRRQLLRSPEGTTRLLEALIDLRRALLATDPAWDGARAAWLEHLLGRRSDTLVPSATTALSRATLGDPRALDSASIAHLPSVAAIQLWARHRLAEAVAAELDRLTAHFEEFDFAALAADRAEAPDRALFDPSPQATLARRYEASHSRLFFRALREFRAVEAEATERADLALASPWVRNSLPPTPPPLPPPPTTPVSRVADSVAAAVVDLSIGQPATDRHSDSEPLAPATTDPLGSFGDSGFDPADSACGTHTAENPAVLLLPNSGMRSNPLANPGVATPA